MLTHTQCSLCTICEQVSSHLGQDKFELHVVGLLLRKGYSTLIINKTYEFRLFSDQNVLDLEVFALKELIRNIIRIYTEIKWKQKNP